MNITKRLSYSLHHLAIKITQGDDRPCYVNVETKEREIHHAFTPSEFKEFVDLMEKIRTDMYAQFNTEDR